MFNLLIWATWFVRVPDLKWVWLRWMRLMLNIPMQRSGFIQQFQWNSYLLCEKVGTAHPASSVEKYLLPHYLSCSAHRFPVLIHFSCFWSKQFLTKPLWTQSGVNIRLRRNVTSDENQCRSVWTGKVHHLKRRQHVSVLFTTCFHFPQVALKSDTEDLIFDGSCLLVYVARPLSMKCV